MRGEWIKENKDGGYHFTDLRHQEQLHPIEEVGAQLRGMMRLAAGEGEEGRDCKTGGKCEGCRI